MFHQTHSTLIDVASSSSLVGLHSVWGVNIDIIHPLRWWKIQMSLYWGVPQGHITVKYAHLSPPMYYRWRNCDSSIASVFVLFFERRKKPYPFNSDWLIDGNIHCMCKWIQGRLREREWINHLFRNAGCYPQIKKTWAGNNRLCV